MAMLTEVLNLETPCAIAKAGEATVLVEIASYMDGTDMGLWYDMQGPTGRKHNFMYGGLESVWCDLSALGIDIDTLDWQTTDQHVDWSNCTCQECKEFCLAYNIIPRGIPWYEALWYRLKFTWGNFRWMVYIRWLMLREQFTR